MKEKQRSAKLRGRPQMESGKRVKKVEARFTEDEFKLICHLERTLGIRKTDLVRLRVLDNARSIVVNAGEIITLLDSLGAELGRSGNNINQLARYANHLRNQNLLSPVVAERSLVLIEQHNTQQKALITALRQLIRQLGK